MEVVRLMLGQGRSGGLLARHLQAQPSQQLGLSDASTAVPGAVCTARQYDCMFCGRATPPALLAIWPAFIGPCLFGRSWLPRLEASNFESFSSPWLRSFPSSIVVCPVLRRISSQKVKFSSLTARCFCSTLSGRYLSRQVYLHILTHLSCNHFIPPLNSFKSYRTLSIPALYELQTRFARTDIQSR